MIIQQPGVTAADFTGRKSPAVLLKKAYGKEQVKTKRNVPEVVGDVDAADLAAYIARNCHAVVQDEEPERKFPAQQGYEEGGADIVYRWLRRYARWTGKSYSSEFPCCASHRTREDLDATRPW